MFTGELTDLEHEFRELVRRQKELRVHFWHYLRHARPGAVLTAPLIYLGIVPFLMLDLFLSTYQAVCFPIYGIPKVNRGRYITIDRVKLQYLNGVEKLNCLYCSYANGLAAYFCEIAARTEQHWCPIKHSHPVPLPHSRYRRFFDYGDAEDYRKRLEPVRSDFSDVSGD